MSDYFLFTLLFLILCNWMQIRYLFGNLFVRKKLTECDGKGLLPILHKKTGLNLSIKVMDEKIKVIGFMVSSPPFKPTMIFSKRLYQIFSKDEFEWVTLHESAHYLMWHNLKFGLTLLAVYVTGICFLSLFSTHILVQLLASIVFSVIYVQLVKIFEYQADNFAVKNMSNPKAMISGNLKMKKENRTFSMNKYLQFLLVIAVPYETRISMARKEIMRRKNF